MTETRIVEQSVVSQVFVGDDEVTVIALEQGGVGPTGPPGEQGPPGESFVREARSDWVAPNSYMGIAAEGSSESATVWKVTRVTVSGSSVTVAVASPIRWTDRLTAVYS